MLRHSVSVLYFEERHEEMFRFRRIGFVFTAVVIVVVRSDRIPVMIPHPGSVRIARILLVLLRLLHAGDPVLPLHVPVEGLTVPD